MGQGEQSRPFCAGAAPPSVLASAHARPPPSAHRPNGSPASEKGSRAGGLQGSQRLASLRRVIHKDPASLPRPHAVVGIGIVLVSCLASARDRWPFGVSSLGLRKEQRPSRLTSLLCRQGS